MAAPAPTLWVTPIIFKKASDLLGPSLREVSNGAPIREAVELVLKSDLGAENGGQKPKGDEKVVDAGALLQKGLQILANNPYAALDIELGVKTIDVRKAFRKMALKYHPDKNPKTTPLFQAIQSASEKLSDAGTRRTEEQRAAAFNMANTSAARNSVPTKPSAPPPNSYKPPHMPNFSSKQAPSAGFRAAPHGPEHTQQKRAEPQANQRHDSGASTPRTTSEQAQSEAQRRQESVRLEAEAKAKYAAFRREEEARQAKELEEAARRHRDDILQQGARKNMAEQQRAREERMQREKEAAKAKEAERQREAQQTAADARIKESLRRQGIHKEKPTPTPDETARTASGPAAPFATNFSKVGGGNSGGVGQTFTASSNGNVRASGAAGSASAAMHSRFNVNQEQRLPVPKPYGLSAIAIGATMCELEWKLSTLPAAQYGNVHIPSAQRNRQLVIEFAWRCTGPREIVSGWQSSTRLVSGHRVRKKNLARGGQFEFRVRAVEDLVGGLLGDRSEWSDVLGVSLVTDPSLGKAPSAQKGEGLQDDEWEFVNVSDDDEDDRGKKPSAPSARSFFGRQNPVGQSGRNLDRKDSKLAWTDEVHSAGSAGSSQPQSPGLGKADKESFNQTHYAKFYDHSADDTAGTNVSSADSGKSKPKSTKDGASSEGGSSAALTSDHPPGDTATGQSWADEEWYDLVPNTTSARARNGPITTPSYEHPVRRHPNVDSEMVGYLIPGLSVQARLAPAQTTSSKGSGFNWLYVRYHMRAKGATSSAGSSKEPVGEWGYSLRSEKGHVFLVRAETYSEDDLSEPDEAPVDQASFEVAGDGERAVPECAAAPSDCVDVWQEQWDESNGCSYFYNPATGDSSWTSPEWIEELDQASGANYYVKVEPVGALPLHSTWSRPKSFARLVRLSAVSAGQT